MSEVTQNDVLKVAFEKLQQSLAFGAPELSGTHIMRCFETVMDEYRELYERTKADVEKRCAARAAEPGPLLRELVNDLFRPRDDLPSNEVGWRQSVAQDIARAFRADAAEALDQLNALLPARDKLAQELCETYCRIDREVPAFADLEATQRYGFMAIADRVRDYVRVVLRAAEQLGAIEKDFCIEGDYCEDGVHPVRARLVSLSAELAALRTKAPDAPVTAAKAPPKVAPTYVCPECGAGVFCYPSGNVVPHAGKTGYCPQNGKPIAAVEPAAQPTAPTAEAPASADATQSTRLRHMYEGMALAQAFIHWPRTFIDLANLLEEKFGARRPGDWKQVTREAILFIVRVVDGTKRIVLREGEEPSKGDSLTPEREALLRSKPAHYHVHEVLPVLADLRVKLAEIERRLRDHADDVLGVREVRSLDELVSRLSKNHFAIRKDRDKFREQLADAKHRLTLLTPRAEEAEAKLGRLVEACRWDGPRPVDTYVQELEEDNLASAAEYIRRTQAARVEIAEPVGDSIADDTAAMQTRHARGHLEVAGGQPLAKCPTCNSHSPRLHPAVQHEGEVELCRDSWHRPAPAAEQLIRFEPPGGLAFMWSLDERSRKAVQDFERSIVERALRMGVTVDELARVVAEYPDGKPGWPEQINAGDLVRYRELAREVGRVLGVTLKDRPDIRTLHNAAGQPVQIEIVDTPEARSFARQVHAVPASQEDLDAKVDNIGAALREFLSSVQPAVNSYSGHFMPSTMVAAAERALLKLAAAGAEGGDRG